MYFLFNRHNRSYNNGLPISYKKNNHRQENYGKLVNGSEENNIIWKYSFLIEYHDKSKNTTVRTDKLLKNQDITLPFKIKHNKKFVNMY